MNLPVPAILRASNNVDLLGAVASLYAQLDARITARRPVCINRGECCKFGAFGHRLYVTPVELAYFIARRGELIRVSDSVNSCPYQRGGVCTTREARPMGCRIFFCDLASQDWQPDETESTLKRIKKLHQRFDLPYAYVEWLAGLAEIDSARPNS